MKPDLKEYRPLTILTLLAIGMLFSATVVTAFFHPSSSFKKFGTAGGVEISALYLVHESELQDETTFRINLSSITDDVSRYDLKELSYLSADGGPFEQAVDWESTGDARHVQGNLRFTGHNLHGTRQVQLIVKGIDNSGDQIFEWKATDKK